MDEFAERLRALMAERGFGVRALARTVPCDPALISRFANGEQSPSAQMARHLDEVLAAGGELIASLGRRDALKLGLAVSLTPGALRCALAEAAGEALEFTRSASATTVGAGTFAHLDEVIAALGRSYPVQAPGALFPVVRSYRAQVQRFIDGPCTLSQKRELYVHTAWLSETMAWLSHDLGAPLAAHARAVDCLEHARPAAHPLGVRLRTQAARGHARLGERDACQALIDEAERRYERMPGSTAIRGGGGSLLAAFAVTAYSASCWVWLGDFAKAAGYARRAVEVHESASAAERSPTREAIARVDLAIAVAGQGGPGEAAELGCQALDSPRLTGSVLSRARDLHAVLAHRYPGQEEAARFRARYEHATACRQDVAAIDSDA